MVREISVNADNSKISSVASYFSDFTSNPDEVNLVSNITATPVFINLLGRPTDHSAQRGKIIREISYNEADTPISENLYEYSYNIPAGKVGYGLDLYSMNPYGITNIMVQVYEIPLYSYNLKKVTTKEYRPALMTTIQEITYNNKNLKNKVSVSTSKSGETLVSTYKYPADYSATPYTTMVTKNMINPVVETEQRLYTSSTAYSVLQKQKYNYALYHSNKICAPGSVETYEGNTLASTVNYTYDQKGNITEISRNGADRTVYIWGYNYQYPVAMAQNATSTNLENAVKAEFSVTNANAFSALTSPAASTIQKIGKNSNLTSALVTSYSYKPGVGMISLTDPTHFTTFFDYDSNGRLVKSSFMEGSTSRTLETYKYNHVNK